MQKRRAKQYELISQTATCGSTVTCNSLSSLAARPNGKFAVLVGLLVSLSSTCTETGSDTLTAYEYWQMLSSMTLKHTGIARFNGMSGISLVRRGVQAGEFYSPEQLTAFLNFADVTATGTVSMKHYIWLAPGWNKTRDVRGGIPVSELNKGELSFVIGSSAVSTTDGSNKFVSGDVTLTVTAIIDELDYPPDVLLVEESESIEANSTDELPGKGKERRILYCLYADDSDSGGADMTQSTAGYSVEIDGSLYASNQKGATTVLLTDICRQDGINDIVPDVTPVFNLDQAGFRIENCPIARDQVVVTNVGSQHTGSRKRICGIAYRPDRGTLRQIWQRWGVSDEAINSYFSELDSATGNKTVANVKGIPLTHVDSSDIAGDAVAILKV